MRRAEKRSRGLCPLTPEVYRFGFREVIVSPQPCTKKRRDPQITPRKPSTALRSLLSVALSSVLVKHLHYSTECGRCTVYDITCPRIGEHFRRTTIFLEKCVLKYILGCYTYSRSISKSPYGHGEFLTNEQQNDKKFLKLVQG